MVRPLLSPMAEAAFEQKHHSLPDKIKYKIRAMSAATDNIGLFFGEDIFVAFGAIILMHTFLRESGIETDPLHIALWGIPTALCAFAIHALRLHQFDRQLKKLQADAAGNTAKDDAVINTNLKSVFNLTKGATKHMMRAKYGSIINITSVVGIKGNAGQANYAASKAGIIGFTKSIALELGSRNIRCNAIAPGFIETEMTDVLNQDIVNQWREAIPMKRGGTPKDVADLVVFLASDMSSYITGQVIHVNGGMLT